MVKAAPHGMGRIQADRRNAICCDVLDAWFEPSPLAISAFAGDALSMRTSPETDGFGLIEAIAEARGLNPNSISIGAGSSEIMYRVLPSLYGSGPAVILDPSYSEYPHLLHRDGQTVRQVALAKANDFNVDLSDLIRECAGASLVILVNPNNPTGQAITRQEILKLKACLDPNSVLWVDEAYVDYCPPGTSVEVDAGSVEGLFVLKSMSKAYALSGVRAAYLVCQPSIASEIRGRTPPWIIGTSAQGAAGAAIGDHSYYADRWAENAQLVSEFTAKLRQLGLTVYPGWINAILVEVPEGRSASDWAACLARYGLIVRTPEGMGEVLTDRFIRIGIVKRSIQPQVIARITATL